MGMYMYVSEQDRIEKRKVSQKAINDIFQEALSYCPSLMIEERVRYESKRIGLFRFTKLAVYTYNVFHETPALDGSPYQAMYMSCACGNVNVVFAYLYGIINGAMAQKKPTP